MGNERTSRPSMGTVRRCRENLAVGIARPVRGALVLPALLRLTVREEVKGRARQIGSLMELLGGLEGYLWSIQG
jgi:hypothetical protein